MADINESRKNVHIGLDWPAPTKKDMLNEVNIPLVEGIDRYDNTEYAGESDIFIDKKGWWHKEKVRGKYLLGVKIRKDEKEYYFWPGILQLHKLLMGFIFSTIKNDQQNPKTNPDLEVPKGRILEKDLSGFKSLLENVFSYLKNAYGQRWLDDFVEEVKNEA